MNDENNNYPGLGAGFDVVSESLIPAQIINQVTTSISQILNNHFSTCAEATTYELFLRIYYTSDFIDISEKENTVNQASADTLHHAKENNTAMHHTKEKKIYT